MSTKFSKKKYILLNMHDKYGGSIRSTWPPKMNEPLIAISDGFSIEGIPVAKLDDNQMIIKVSNQQYRDKSLASYPQFNNGYGFHILSSSGNWYYRNNINVPLNNSYSNGNVNPYHFSTSGKSVHQIHPTQKLYNTPQVTLTGKIYNGPMFINQFYNSGDPRTRSTVHPDFAEFIKKNPKRYELALKNIELYREEDINKILVDTGEKIRNQMQDGDFIEDMSLEHYNNDDSESPIIKTPINKEVRNDIANKLLPNFKEDPKLLREAKDEPVVTNLDLAEHELIDSEHYELNEGKKIRSWIYNEIYKNCSKINEEECEPIFHDIYTEQFLGYVYIARAGIEPFDRVNKYHLANREGYQFKYFNDIIGKPIDSRRMVSNLLNQNDSPIFRELKDETEKILGLEYLICLQPKPKYQLFALKKLILAWYADDLLTLSILKIKIIINQWRCRRDVDENVHLGVLPSIVIYPRYGVRNFNIVLNKLATYFGIYDNIGWEGNDPDYFQRYQGSELIYYTNGSLDLKRILETYPRKTEYYQQHVPNVSAFMKSSHIVPNFYSTEPSGIAREELIYKDKRLGPNAETVGLFKNLPFPPGQQ